MNEQCGVFKEGGTDAAGERLQQRIGGRQRRQQVGGGGRPLQRPLRDRLHLQLDGTLVADFLLRNVCAMQDFI